MEEFLFQKFFVNRDSVGLWVTHPDRSNSECFLFRDLDDMDACSSVHRYIPLSVWDELAEMLLLTKAHYKSLH